MDVKVIVKMQKKVPGGVRLGGCEPRVIEVIVKMPKKRWWGSGRGWM